MVAIPNTTSSEPRFRPNVQRQGRAIRGATIVAAGIVGVGLLAACSQASKPATRVQEAPAQSAPAPPAPPAAATTPAADPAPASVAAAEETPPADDTKKPLPNSTVTYVDSADSASKTPQTLAEAAKAEKERRAQATPPKIVITNKTLPRYAKGQLTVADPHFQKPKTPATPSSTSGAESTHDEQYWRGHVLDIRLRWRHAVDEVKELEQSAGDWRRRFYAQDDPFVRDGQIKPEWDRVLDRLRQARVEVDKAKKDLADFLEAGRREGAFPGWLREGIEQEPAEAKPVNPTDAIEPPILKEHGA